MVNKLISNVLIKSIDDLARKKKPMQKLIFMNLQFSFVYVCANCIQLISNSFFLPSQNSWNLNGVRTLMEFGEQIMQIVCNVIQREIDCESRARKIAAFIEVRLKIIKDNT